MNDELTLKEVAAELALATVTLRQQIKDGKLAATKRGRDWFVTRDEVERYRRENLGKVGRPIKRES